jgi:hypothetical protein
MSLKVQIPVFFRLLLFCIPLAVTIGCGSRTPQLGTYIAEMNAHVTPNQRETSLELKETGVGVWRVGDDEVALSWYVKNDELRLNTKSGGVIVARMDNEVLHITLPGSEDLTFRRVK